MFISVGHDLLTTFNTSLNTWVVPDCLKTDTVTPLLKSPIIEFFKFFAFLSKTLWENFADPFVDK